MRKTKEKDAEYMRAYRKSKKEEMFKDKKELLKYCFPNIDYASYSDEDYDREIEYLDRLIDTCIDKKQFIIDNISKYAFIDLDDIDDNDIYELIRNEFVRLSIKGFLQLVNIHMYSK